MYRVFKSDGHCIQFDNDQSAEIFAANTPQAVEMTQAEISETFGANVAHVGPHNTKVAADGKVSFVYTPDIPSLKLSKQNEIVREADVILKNAGAEYCDMERQTWEQQYAEAVAYKKNPDADVPMLTAIATKRGMPVAQMADRVIANKTSWGMMAGAVVGQRLAYQDRLKAAATVEAIEAIQVDYTLPQ